MKVLILALLIASCGSQKTTGGVAVNGLAVIPPAAETAIEQGIQISVDVAKCKGWTKGLALSNYTVDLRPGIISHDGVVAYSVPCGAYCGTVWDQGGWILVGGQESNNTLTLPYIQGREADLQLAAQFEVEHSLCRFNSTELYNATKVHGVGTGHPFLHCP